MIVLDASVLLKWFVEEVDSPQALIYRRRHLEGKDFIAVPELTFYEIANVLVTRTKLSPDEIERNLKQLHAYEFEVAHWSELPGVIRIARTYALTIYDASYVALARLLKCPLVTADVQLTRKLHRTAFVHLLKGTEL